MGYTEFANKIYNLVKKTRGNDKNDSEKLKKKNSSYQKRILR